MSPINSWEKSWLWLKRRMNVRDFTKAFSLSTLAKCVTHFGSPSVLMSNPWASRQAKHYSCHCTSHWYEAIHRVLYVLLAFCHRTLQEYSARSDAANKKLYTNQETQMVILTSALMSEFTVNDIPSPSEIFSWTGPCFKILMRCNTTLTIWRKRNSQWTRGWVDKGKRPIYIYGTTHWSSSYRPLMKERAL